LNTATTGLPGLSCRENKKRDRLRGLIPIVVELVAQKNERQNARLAGGIDAHLALEAVDVEVPVSVGSGIFNTPRLIHSHGISMLRECDESL
jgi:hypothetical protein